ncbi:unnamed protein product [Rhizophagus irregularis]|uniref:Uncharacterized protein n=1 Tax=Rhizophagus irregularis TaxID=588596 RepID=A0A2I1EPA8_9GLOM|nr:hypothetical protein RhiirB3_387646 [Rhizophagus irregularis]CAB4481948.1 unnamed protein product [Rhizophagus irregularis]CAB5302490.1 unnamed protein product [Rhizophagus irregularis]
MAFTPYIEIDWSSTSQQPYPQLGDPTPPENDSDKILHNIEHPMVLSAKDILSFDIDDIYPYTYSTLHLEDDKMEEFYDDEDDYFEQLAKAEIEETSYGGNDIPSVSSAPITSTQDNIPLPPSDIMPITKNLLKNWKKTTRSVSLKKFHVTTPK